MLSDLNTKGCCLICLVKVEEKVVKNNCKNAKTTRNINLLTKLCKLLKISDNEKKDVQICKKERKIKREEGSTEPILNTAIYLCPICIEITKELSRLFVKLEKIQLEVDYHLKKVHRRISGVYKNVAVVQKYSRIMTADAASLVTLAKVDNLRKRILKKCSVTTVPEVRLTKLDLNTVRHQKSIMAQLVSNQILNEPANSIPFTLQTPKGYMVSKGRLIKTRYDCKFCGKTFPHKGTRAIHQKQYHSYYWEAKCDICFRKFIKPRDFKMHLKFAHFCKVCNVKCLTREEYKLHQTHLHKNSKMGTSITKFKRCRNRNPNLSKISENRPSAKEKKKVDQNIVFDETTKMFKCGSCDKKYRTKGAIQTHYQVKHLKIRYPCKLCQQTFTCQSSLRYHNKMTCKMKRIVKETKKMAVEYNFTCDICMKKFTTKEIMNQHQRKVHFDMQNSECTTCGKTFTTNGSLTRHRREVHEKDKVFSCDICKKIWPSRYPYTDHLKKCKMEIKKESQKVSRGRGRPPKYEGVKRTGNIGIGEPNNKTECSEPVVESVQEVDIKPVIKIEPVD